MTVSSTTTKNSYSGDGSTTVFAYTFKIFDDDDVSVIVRTDSTGSETVKTKTTDYTVSGVGNANGGNVTFVTAPASGETVVLIRSTSQTQTTDYTPNDPFPASAHEDALDKMTFLAQELQEEVDRSIKVSKTNTITSSEFTIGASDRANKIFAFDSNGDFAVTQEIGTFKGSDATTTTSNYKQRDLIKSTTAAELNNVYICVADSVAGDLLTDTDHFELIVDAVTAATSATNASTSATAASTSATAAATSATNAATSATNAATSATNASTSETNASTSATNAATSATSAQTAQTAAETALDDFTDIFLGSKATDPTLDNDGNALIDGALYFDTTNNVLKVYDLGNTQWNRTTPTSSDQTNINTVSGISANVTTVAGISANVTTVAGISSDVSTVAADGTDIGTVAGISANVTTVAGVSSDVTTVAGISSDVTTVSANDTNVTTVASNISGVNSFADRYRVGATDPTTSLDEGDLFYNTTDDVLKYYNGSAWQNIQAGITQETDPNALAFSIALG